VPSDLPSDTLVVDGRRRVFDFTPREAELVRLSVVFNLAVRDIADELVVSSAWASEVVSAVYRKLGLREILTGETPLEAHFDDEAVLARCREITRRTKITARDGRFRKAPWMSTLAFHLLTVPETRQLP
jgi:DNA-binding NarL/FixJ family response regulator